MRHSSTPWWRTEIYDVADAVPPQFDYDWAGPKGLALVRVWKDGRTSQGWGLQGPTQKRPDGTAVQLPGFMPRYLRGEFSERRTLNGYKRGLWAFAFVMRSVHLICIDIDGKNGGFSGAKKLGMLPPTMAETSKSGTGFHLFYLVDEPWDDTKGFGSLPDRIGIEEGVDIRATGCVYHYDTQRWNRRVPVELPEHLHEVLRAREEQHLAAAARITSVLASHDELEVLMLHDEILTDLKKPIPQGRRNVTLFALGNQMRQAQVPDWETRLTERATQVGLDQTEIDKLVANINRYGSPMTP